MKNKRILPMILITLVSIYLILPLLLTGAYSFFSRWVGILPEQFTSEYYQALFADSDFWPSIVRGLVICIPSILLSLTCVLLALYVAVIYNDRLEKVIRLFCMIPKSLQGVILAISLLSLYAGSRGPLGNRIVMLIAAYAVIILPIVFNTIRNSMYSVNIRQLIEAAEILGTSKFYAFIRIVLPCMRSGLLIASLTSMTIIFGDFAIVKIIASGQWRTAMMFLYKSRSYQGQLQSAIILIIFVIILIISFSALALQNNNKTREVPDQTEEK